ncbi:hypothetical protein [Egicoccus sp. AB-alg6-2]|uniref:hypothetical protein n=1 Tax=Egicoccus sp. AB-alg6-2 TaxID=3242692 RepID=UPI00359D5622
MDHDPPPRSDQGAPGSGDGAPTPPSSAPGVVPVDLRDYVDFSAGAATRVRVLASPQLALDLWCIEPHQATGVLHEPDRDLTYTVVGGRSWFVTDEGEVGLDPMGAMLVPAGVVHGIDNRAPDPLIVVAVGAPPGDEPPATPVARDARAVRHDGDGTGPLRRTLHRLFGDT